ncbi:MAG: LysR family transcriptional regulator [Betaproteobacteria bacterium]|nr:LysR family transcriptional regulator [Betaproteobacteria bacterium]
MTCNIDFIDLRLLVHIVETSSLTKGAEHSNLSAPAASARLKKMEENWGVGLFHRSSQGLIATSAGEAVLRHARKLLGQLGELTAELQADGDRMRGNIRLYANTLSISEFLPAALQSFLIEYPEVNIELHERSSNEIARALKQGQADLGILSSEKREEGLRYVDYRTERLVLVMPLGHALAIGRPVNFRETLAFDYVGMEERLAMQAFLLRAAAREQLPMKLRIQANSFETLCRLVESGIGIGVIPETIARRHALQQSISVAELVDAWAIRDLHIAIRAEIMPSAPVKALIAGLTAAEAAL